MDNVRVKSKNYSTIQVDCDNGIAAELTDHFSFFVPGYRFMPAYKNGWDGKIRLFNGLNKELPAGLFPYVEKFCAARDYNLETLHDNYFGSPDDRNEIDLEEFIEFVESLNLHSDGKKISPRDYQLRGIIEAIHRKRIILLSPTGSGKSLMIYVLIRWMMKRHNKKILVIVPTTSLVKQMYSDFADYSSHDDSFFAGQMCHQIQGGKEKNDKNSRIYISTWQSVYKMPPSYFEQFGSIFGDEVHGFKSKSLTSLMNKCRNGEYRVGTTGTLDGTQTHKLVLEGLFGKVYIVTTTKKLQDNDTLAQLDISVLLLKYPDEIRKDWGKVDYHKEVDYIVRNESRNKFIRNLTLSQKGNTLVLFNLVEKHGKVLYEDIRKHAAEGRKVYFVAGETDADDREAIRKIVETQEDAIIVASEGTFSTGINIKNLHNVIRASTGKAPIKLLQGIGRTLRKATNGMASKLFDIADDISWKKRKNYALKHCVERMKIYDKEQFKYKIYKIDLDT